MIKQLQLQPHCYATSCVQVEESLDADHRWAFPATEHLLYGHWLTWAVLWTGWVFLGRVKESSTAPFPLLLHQDSFYRLCWWQTQMGLLQGSCSPVPELWVLGTAALCCFGLSGVAAEELGQDTLACPSRWQQQMEALPLGGWDSIIKANQLQQWFWFQTHFILNSHWF